LSEERLDETTTEPDVDDVVIVKFVPEPIDPAVRVPEVVRLKFVVVIEADDTEPAMTVPVTAIVPAVRNPEVVMFMFPDKTEPDDSVPAIIFPVTRMLPAVKFCATMLPVAVMELTVSTPEVAMLKFAVTIVPDDTIPAIILPVAIIFPAVIFCDKNRAPEERVAETTPPDWRYSPLIFMVPAVRELV
jgi:hypothetical protein